MLRISQLIQKILASCLCVIHRYFQTTGSCAAKLGKMRDQKNVYFDMVYWINHRCHGNTGGIKQALNNGLDLLSENSVIRFFSSFVSKNLEKYWPIAEV